MIFQFQNAKITAWGLGYKAPKKSFPAKTVLVVEIEPAKLKPEPGAFKYTELRFQECHTICYYLSSLQKCVILKRPIGLLDGCTGVICPPAKTQLPLKEEKESRNRLGQLL